MVGYIEILSHFYRHKVRTLDRGNIDRRQDTETKKNKQFVEKLGREAKQRRKRPTG